ncbi:MAG: AAA family ATPase [Chloroflexi bacterium]|nr:AAA family ATPase [Chloroflexota bacterium]
MMNEPSLGQLVRDLRRAGGLTQEELAARAGLSTRAISDLERGVNHTPRPTTVQLLAAGLGLSDREREHFDAVARAHEENGSSGATGAALAARELAGASASTRGPSATPLIGRARQRAVLEQHLAGEGPPLLLVGGEPGIGKTRLLHEAAALGAGFRLHALWGTVLSPGGQADSLDPIADALRRAVQSRSPVLLRRDLQGCAALVDVLPELAPSHYGGAESARETADPALMASAVVRFMANTAGPAGTLLILDNLHDAGASSLALLARLVRSSSDVPVRIVAAYRDGHCSGRDPLSALLAMLAHEHLVRHLELSPLSTREAANLLTAVASQRSQSIEPWPAQALHDSGGVPFYVVAWAEHLELLGQQHADATFPWPIQQSVRFRMDAGPASVRPVLEALAASGGRASSALLRELAAQSPESLQAALEWSIRERLLAEDDQDYVFAYGVIRTAVDSELEPTRRQIIRRRLAAVLRRHRERLAAIDARPARDGHVGVRSVRTRSASSARDEERAYHLAVLRQRLSTRAARDQD